MDNPATVLIAEDSRFLRKATELILTKAGFRVITAGDGEETIALARATAPDVIVLDLLMPKRNGIDVIRALKQEARTSSIPVIVLSVFSQANEEKLMRAGASAYYEKTKLVPEALVNIVRQMLEQRASTSSAQNGKAKQTVIEEERDTLLTSNANGREYEHQLFEQLIAVNNELLAAQRELAEANSELRRISSVDELTGLANRRKATEDVERLLCLARRHNEQLSIAMLDIDQFKDINDLYGHAAGDLVLRGFGGILMKNFRSEDVVARWGGEEFLVALYGCSLAEGVQRLERLRAHVEKQSFSLHEGSAVQITFSAGVAEFPAAGSDFERLCHSADTALYTGKRGGRNRVVAGETSSTPSARSGPTIIRRTQAPQ